MLIYLTMILYIFSFPFVSSIFALCFLLVIRCLMVYDVYLVCESYLSSLKIFILISFKNKLIKKKIQINGKTSHVQSLDNLILRWNTQVDLKRVNRLINISGAFFFFGRNSQANPKMHVKHKTARIDKILFLKKGLLSWSSG